MALTIYFLRHGQTPFSRENRVAGAGTDVGLTSEGEAMAIEFAKAYSDIRWQGIFCSPLLRTRLTAGPLIDRLRMEVQLRPGLRDIEMGSWEGRELSDIKENSPKEYIAWEKDPATNAPPGGETAIQIAMRARTVIQEIRDRYPDGNVLVVSHKATIRIALCDLLGIDLSLFRARLACPVCSVAVVEFGPQGALLVSIGDRNYMSAKLRELPGT